MGDTSKPYLQIDVALVHHPILGRDGSEITTSITPMDLHDISRTCKTYDVQHYYVVHPHVTMKTIAQRVRDYWQQGAGKAYEHNRSDAFQLMEIVDSLDEALYDAKARRGVRPLVVATSARKHETMSVSCGELRERLRQENRAAMLVFGTGWGLKPEMVARMDALVEPIRGDAAFNHLSVRSAVAITLDRLVGDRIGGSGDAEPEQSC